MTRFADPRLRALQDPRGVRRVRCRHGNRTRKPEAREAQADAEPPDGRERSVPLLLAEPVSTALWSATAENRQWLHYLLKRCVNHHSTIVGERERYL